ncbi:MAG: hypothetical protein ACM3PP_04010 [Candidatus Saccharibacteria bacterium]
MDYIKEINAFYDHDMANQLSQSAGYLYLALLNLANRLFWKEGFTVSDNMLMARTGMKDKRTFRRALEELTHKGLVAITENDQGQAYTITGLAWQTPGRSPSDEISSGTRIDSHDNLSPGRGCAKNAAKNVTRNAAKDAEPAEVVAKNAALDAEKIDDFAKSAALNATFLAEKNTVFAENAATSATFFARDDGSETSNGGLSSPAQAKQTKQIKQNELNKSAYADSVGEGEETGEESLKNCSGSEDSLSASPEPVTNRELIAELAGVYRATPGIAPSKGDFAFIGSLYNEYGYERVLYGVHELAMAAAASQIEKPLLYLKAILRRAGPSPPVSAPGMNTSEIREEDPLERYERERYRG